MSQQRFGRAIAESVQSRDSVPIGTAVLSYAIDIALSYGKNEAKFTSMTYKDATITTTLHTYLFLITNVMHNSFIL
jgi:hypothetical protein